MGESGATAYIFGDAEIGGEYERLRALEAVCDPASLRRLSAVGVSPGQRCLEVGAGAGSILRWLSDRVGDTGRVTAVELQPAHIKNRMPANAALVDGDVRGVALGRERFDLIHCRYVLIHLPDYAELLERFVTALVPGGWLVVEEPEFTSPVAAHGTPRQREAFDRVTRAIWATYAARGVDHRMAYGLPAQLEALGLGDLHAEHEAPIVRGSSLLARMMRLSCEHLRPAYLATGEATAEDLDAYADFAENRTTWAVYYGTVAVSAQKP